jgi:hypothetical protein
LYYLQICSSKRRRRRRWKLSRHWWKEFLYNVHVFENNATW